jgi:hypothetical protein
MNFAHSPNYGIIRLGKVLDAQLRSARQARTGHGDPVKGKLAPLATNLYGMP